MGCWVSIHHRRTESDESPPPADYPSARDNDGHHHHQLPPINRPPPNLALLSNVHTLRSHLAMSPLCTPQHPSYPRRETMPTAVGYQSRFRRNQVAAVNHHVFDDLSNVSNEVQKIGFSTTPDFWNRLPPPPAADAWSSTAAAPRGRTLTKSELMSRRERERERGVMWDPLSGDFSAMSASKEKRVETTTNGKLSRKVTFGELPGKKGVGDGPGPRAARRVARSRFGGWGLADRCDGGGGSPFEKTGAPVTVEGRDGAVSVRQQRRNVVYDGCNELMSVEGFVFF